LLIRCERCSTVYELDETLLAPEGAPVQCTRCDNVFVAFPSRAPGRTLVGMPAAQAPVATPAPFPAPTPAPTKPSVPGARPTPGPRAPASDARARGPTPQVYRPGPPSSPSRPAPVLRKDQVGAFESRLRWSARWKWLAPTLAAAMVVTAGAAWLFLVGRTDPEATRARSEGLALLTLDDATSLDAAIARLDEAVRREPSLTAAVADGALARLLRAELLREEWEDGKPRGPAGEAEKAATSQDPRMVRSRELSAAAWAALEALGQDSAGGAALRARAFGYAQRRDRTHLSPLLSAARMHGESDPWLDVSEATLDLEGNAEHRERAVVRLGALVAGHPEIVRARWLLARGQASLGRTPEALAALEGVIAANARHDGARRLRAALTMPPSPPGGSASPADGGSAAPAPPPAPRRRAREEALAPVTPEVVPSPVKEISPLTDRPEPEHVQKKEPAAPASPPDAPRDAVPPPATAPAGGGGR